MVVTLCFSAYCRLQTSLYVEYERNMQEMWQM